MPKQNKFPEPKIPTFDVPADPKPLDSNDEIQERIRKMNEEERGTGWKPLRKVAVIQLDRFSIKVAGSEEPIAKFEKLTGNIVAAKIGRAYYATKGQRAPSCSSRDGGITGTVNHEVNAEIGYNIPIEDGQACSYCPFNEWGSAKDDTGAQKKGKACGERRNLLMMTDEFNEPIVVSLSPSSLGAWDAFADKLASRNDSYITKRVRLGVQTKKQGTNEFGVVTFEILGSLVSEDTIQAFAMREQYMPLIGAVQLPSLSELSETPPAEQVEEREIPF